MFTTAEDKGAKLTIGQNGKVLYKKRWRNATWITSRPADGENVTVVSVDDCIGKAVLLSDDSEFKNPALKPIPMSLASLDLKTIEDAKAKAPLKSYKGVLTTTNWSAVARKILDVLTWGMLSAAMPAEAGRPPRARGLRSDVGRRGA